MVAAIWEPGARRRKLEPPWFTGTPAPSVNEAAEALAHGSTSKLALPLCC